MTPFRGDRPPVRTWRSFGGANRSERGAFPRPCGRDCGAGERQLQQQQQSEEDRRYACKRILLDSKWIHSRPLVPMLRLGIEEFAVK
jgi:hypothetical protein